MNADLANSQSQTSESAAPSDVPQGITGKAVTRVVIVALVLTIVGISYVLGTYNQIDTRRGEVEVSWRALTDELAARYRDVERDIATGVDAETTPMELGEQFRLAVDRFRTTAQRSLQVEAAREIEALIPQTGVEATSSQALEQSLETFNKDQGRLEKLISSPAGKFLGMVLILDDTRPFELAP